MSISPFSSIGILIFNGFNLFRHNFASYLKRAFVLKDGSAWCYWVTDGKFYPVSSDIVPKEEEKWVYLLFRLSNQGFEVEEFEYSGVCRVEEVGDPPSDIITDEWLEERGWRYDDYWSYRIAP